MENPLLSVVVPVKDEDRLLEDALHVLTEIQSVVPNLEILVIDDGSSSSFVRKLRKWQALILNLRIYRGPGLGLGSARNAGLDLARGKYVFFLDFDDSLCFDSFKECLRLLESSSADFLHFRERRFKSSGKDMVWASDTNFEAEELSSKDLLRRWAASGFWDSSICHQISRRETFFSPNRLRFPTSGLYEDSVLKLQFLLSDFRCLTTEKEVYFRRVRDDSITGSPPQFSHVRDFAKSLWAAMKIALFSLSWSERNVVVAMQFRRLPFLFRLLGRALVTKVRFK